MNRLSALRALLAGCALAVASTASAQVAGPTPEDAPGAPAARQAPASTPDADARVVDERHCLRRTGSLIRPPRENRRASVSGEPCLPVPGRAYTAEDLRNTGYIDLGRALRALDPAIH